MASPALRLSRPASIRSRTTELVLAIAAVIITLAGAIAIGATGYDLVIFGGAIALAVGVTILLHPQIGLYILMIFIFANMSFVIEEQIGFPDSNKYLVGLIFVGTFVRRIMLEKRPIIFELTEMMILIYGSVIIISVFFAPETTDGVPLIIDWLKDFAIILIIIQFSTDETIWKRAQWMLIFTATLLAALSVYQTLTGDFGNNFYGLATAPVSGVTETYSSNRPSGPIQDPNFYGMFLLMVLPMAVYRFLSASSRNAQLTGLISSMVLVLAILFTYSRGAFLALVIVTGLIMLEQRVSLYKVVPLMVIGLLIVIPLLPPGFVERISTLTDIASIDPRSQTESSLRGRSSEAIVAYQMFQDYPLLGVGRGNYEQNYLSYSTYLGLDTRYEEREAHSMYLELAAETGVLGILAFTTMLVILFGGMQNAKRTLRKINRHDLVGWAYGIQFGLIAYLVASIFLHADFMRYFWLIIGFAATCRIVAKTQQARMKDSQIALGFSPNTQV